MTNVNIPKITLRAVLDASGFYRHDEIKCDSIDQPEAQEFIAKYRKDYLIIPYDRRNIQDDNPDNVGYRGKCITDIPDDQWIVEALIFGKDICMTDIQPELTIILTPEQRRELSTCNYNSGGRTSYLKDIGGDLVNQYRMWYVFMPLPKWNAGMMDSKDISYISCPEHLYWAKSSWEIKRAAEKQAMQDNDDDGWKNEIAMQAGMSGGVSAYNEVMGW